MAKKKSTPTRKIPKNLLGDIHNLIETARNRVAQVVNTGLVTLYWSIGDRIRRELLKEKRAEYGEEIVSTLSKQLSREYGRGYSKSRLFYMIRLVEVFPDLSIVLTLSGQLSWSHFLEIIYLPDVLQRNFYAESV